MTYRLFVDSSTGLDVEPEYTFAEQDEKIETVLRSRSGRRYHYRWGFYKRFYVPVTFVDSEFKSTVNDWWNDNQELLYMLEGDTVVHSVIIVNMAKPIGGLIKPYTDLFTGVIELETY